jgi:multidrug/hemolysin transport system permease protein
MSVTDVLLLILDVIILSLFGVAISSAVNFFLSSQGQISAVGSMVSSTYGFLCGAYMPLSQFSEGLRKVLMFLPGTYGTALVRNHAMRGVLAAMEKEGASAEFIKSVKDSFDCNLYMFDKQVSIPVMYAVICGSVVALIGAYVLMNILRERRANKG